ncbi:protein DD3-3 [Nematostella vectensis]|uniref:protein DD3-3 n=1 Tax=Nematostella vectensis TaxID=45351 RepID=UPI002077732B|nr:protein DD3-3 [Nematostella vectensis]
MQAFALMIALLGVVCADINLYNPRGSNNRLDENGRERNNSNRLFDSQNNNRGGHNVGNLYYYTGSHVQVQWANQHSCGDMNNECELVLQYMCGDLVRDGTRRNTIPDNPNSCKNKNCNTDKRYGMHEDYDYYNECRNRARNRGLFTADRKLKGITAKYTRQNNNGNRRGYECPEERDYYPYWHPTPWRDIAVFTNNVTRCSMYTRESENVKGRYKCKVPAELLKNSKFVIPDTMKECKKIKNAVWTKSQSHGMTAPECLPSPWSRDNHQGNTVGGEFMKYDWTVPDMPHERCVFRIRYNITTGDYPAWDPTTDYQRNSRPNIANAFHYQDKYDLKDKKGKRLSDFETRRRGYYYRNDPDVRIFANVRGFKLRIQINTNQDGRTFEDRSHTFAIRKRPSYLKSAKIHNVNVRGKRGNIVQVFPTTEYDFVPNTVTMKRNEYVHFQWTGSDTNPANNAGEGKAGTDRHNVLLLEGKAYPVGVSRSFTYGHWGRNYPMHLDNSSFLGLDRHDLQYLAISYPQSAISQNNEKLDYTGRYFDLGPRKVTKAGTFYYMCTRNNNFTNRSQKGRIVVK